MRILPALIAAGAMISVASFGAAAQSPGTSPTPAENQPSGDAAPANVPDTTVHKAGVAMHHVLAIRQDYTQRMHTTTMPAEQKTLEQQSEAATVKAVTDQGLSIDEYNRVLHLAMADPNLKARLMKEETQAQ